MSIDMICQCVAFDYILKSPFYVHGLATYERTHAYTFFRGYCEFIKY